MSRAAGLLGALAAPLVAVLLGAALLVGASPSGWGYVLGALLTTVGLLTRRRRRWRGLTRAGLGLLVLVLGARVLLTERGALSVQRLPDGGSRLVNRLVDERDGTLLAAHALRLSGRLPRAEARDFVPALESAFTRMREAEGPVATPAVATWLGMQRPEAFDAVLIPPESSEPTSTAVVFLHGYAGNFAVYCWQMSRAARAISALTLCPSVGPEGRWKSPRGEQTLAATYAWLAARGIRRVYLGGLSNGGEGASVLVNRPVPAGLELRGLVLISGAETKAAPPRVPVLLVQGARDTMMPTRLMREYAQRAGRLATSVEVDSGHFAFLDHHAECQGAIATWLRARER